MEKLLPMGTEINDREKQQITFRVFAHQKPGVNLLLRQGQRRHILPMRRELPNLYSLTIEGRGLDLLYKFQLPGVGDFPDPYSGYQPYGVHNFSQVVDHRFYPWRDKGWGGIRQEEMIIYELHVGAFSAAGSFSAVEERLDYLQELGINTIEVMPVSQTPGRWNWGYDGVFPFSVNHNYGSPDEFKRLVDSCHQRGMGVILDVVYNHLGPEGNYLPQFGPYFTDKHQTPWGAAVNYDDDFSEYTRRLVLDNVTHWLTNYHLDGLRLDAVHAIKDDSQPHILQEIARTVRELERELERRLVVIAETDENEARLINPISQGGYGIDAQWLDDFHHCIHTVMTGERQGYYQDYGSIGGFKKVFQNYLYTGEYSTFWKKNRGSDGSAIPGRQFVVATQTHDQVGNRALGERLSQLVGIAQAKVAAGLVMLSAYLPLIFMGEEYAERHPFQFFSDYTLTELADAVSEGRRKEFSQFKWQDVPDPQNPKTFYRSRLTPRSEWDDQNRSMFVFYRDLIALRKEHPALKNPDKQHLEVQVYPLEKVIELTRWSQEEKIWAWFNLGSGEFILPLNNGTDGGPARVLLHSDWAVYGGRLTEGSDTLSPAAMVVYGVSTEH